VEVERGTFRRDLYYRINVISFSLAPLRERTEDIPLLVKYFLARTSPASAMSEDALRLMMAYPWPGNIRELEHCVQRMVAMSSGLVLTDVDLPPYIRYFTVPESAAPHPAPPVRFHVAAAAAGATPAPTTQSLPVPLVELERRAILSALEYAGGNQAMAAHLLGIGRTTLFRKLKEYGKRPDAGS
jgi:DNA-binding NtrC family response regulator